MEARFTHQKLTGRIIGAAMAVHSELGPGFTEPIYERSLRIELRRNEIPFETQTPIQVRYLDQLVGTHRLDLLVDDRVIVELKAIQRFAEHDFARLRSYLKASSRQVGLLINFGTPSLNFRRIDTKPP